MYIYKRINGLTRFVKLCSALQQRFGFVLQIANLTIPVQHCTWQTQKRHSYQRRAVGHFVIFQFERVGGIRFDCEQVISSFDALCKQGNRLFKLKNLRRVARKAGAGARTDTMMNVDSSTLYKRYAIGIMFKINFILFDISVSVYNVPFSILSRMIPTTSSTWMHATKGRWQEVMIALQH